MFKCLWKENIVKMATNLICISTVYLQFQKSDHFRFTKKLT